LYLRTVTIEKEDMTNKTVVIIEITIMKGIVITINKVLPSLIKFD